MLRSVKLHLDRDQEPLVRLAGDFIVDSHRADENEAVYLGLCHGCNDVLRLTWKIGVEICIHDIMALDRFIEFFLVENISFDNVYAL